MIFCHWGEYKTKQYSLLVNFLPYTSSIHNTSGNVNLFKSTRLSNKSITYVGDTWNLLATEE